MEEIQTNDYLIQEITNNYDNKHIDEVKKIVSINKNNYKSSRDFIAISTKYSGDDKKIYLEILDILSSVNTKRKIQTSNYEGKAYTLMFIKEFGAFLRNPENSFTARQIKLLLAIYEIIDEANSVSNCLISCNKKHLADMSGIDSANFALVLKSLEKKNILKVDKFGSIYVNYKYFFMGNSMNYDLYRSKYDNI